MDSNTPEQKQNITPNIEQENKEQINNSLNQEEKKEENNSSQIKNGDKPKKQRRKKADNIPRDFVCEICQKSYLSFPALSSHKKAKHDVEPEKKNRGRPRKNVRILL